MQNTTLYSHSIVVFQVTHNTSLNKRHVKIDLTYKNSPWQRVFTGKIMPPPPPANITIMLVISPHNNQFQNVKMELGELKSIWNLKMYINIISGTKIRRVGWLGKEWRTSDYAYKKYFERERKIGRHNLSPFDEVQSDIRTLRIMRWIHKPRDGQEWKLRSNLQGP